MSAADPLGSPPAMETHASPESEQRPARDAKRILIAGYMGFGNAGDEAILASMAGSFRKLPWPVDLQVVSGDPSRTAERYAVSGVPWQDAAAIADAVRMSDLVVLGGGGLFHDYWGFDPDLLLTDKQWGLSYFAAPAVMAALYRKPLMVYAAGVGPLLSEHGRRFTRVICDSAVSVTVRDGDSRDILVSLGIPEPRITVTADPAFALEMTGTAVELSKPPDGPLIGVVLRHWNIGVDQAFWERQVATALDLLLREQGGKVILVPFQSTSPEDAATAQRVFQLIPCRDRAEVLQTPDSPQQTAAILGQCQVVLGMRLHSLIFSVLGAVPFLAIDYDPKIPAMARELGLADYTVPVGDIDGIRLAERLREVMAEGPRISGRLERLRSTMCARAHENVRLAAAILEKEPPLPPPAPELIEIVAKMVHSHLRLSKIAAAESESRLAAMQRQIAEQDASLVEMQHTVENQALERVRAERDAALEREAARSAEWDRLRAESEIQQAELARQLANAELRLRHLSHELDLAWNQRWISSPSTAASRAASPYTEFLESRLADLEKKSWAAVSKRGLQVMLDLVQLLTPEFLRALVRRYYLEYFYFKIYPERRVNSTQAAPQAVQVSAASSASRVIVYSGYRPFVEFKSRLCRELPMDFGSVSSHRTPGLVSVVMPVYNGQRYVRDSIESVLRQSYEAFELILVDDGSTDQTPDILESYAADPRVRIIHQPNQKLPAALTNGFAAATGEFYTWTSDDNLMMPEQLAELAAFLRARPEVEMVYADEEIIDDAGQPYRNADFCPGYQTPPGSNVICWPRDTGELNYVQNNYIGGCFLYRAWAGKIVGGYTTHCFGFEDYDYWMRMNALFRVSHLGLRQPLYRYRLHANSLSAREKELQIVDRVRNFMAAEEARRHFFIENFDITLVGEHPWFPELGRFYREYGNNVFDLKELNDTSRYHHEVTRAFPKSAMIFSSGISNEELERLLGWSRRERGAALILLVSDAQLLDPAAPVLDAFDWIVATGEALRERIPSRLDRRVLLVKSASALAYPLLAAANTHCYARHDWSNVSAAPALSR